jgi:anti-anti-sigma regulatory factor
MSTTTAKTYDSVRFLIPTRVTRAYAKNLRDDVHEALRLGARRLVVDCDAWSRIDVGVLSTLVQCATACREQGASFQVANMASEILDDLRALGLNERLGLK